MLNWRLFDLTSFTRHSRAEIKQRIAKSLVYIFLLSALVSISGVATAPKAEAGFLRNQRPVGVLIEMARLHIEYLE